MTRMLPTRYLRPDPARIKGRPAAVRRHFSAPLKGLNLDAKLTPGDALQAPILDNWIVTESDIRPRPGWKLVRDRGDGLAVEHLVPHYGSVPKLLGASGGALWDALTGVDVATGFTSNDWHWTSFSNLGTADYTVIVNGSDGVWAWDGATVAEQTVTAPSGEPWIIPDEFNIVVAFQNRLWFADSSNLAMYYLPLQQMTGEVALLPLNAVFKRGGRIVAVYTWTVDGGTGLDDKLCIFTSGGECAIWTGVDPTSPTGFALDGVFRFDAPMSKHCVLNYGGELYVLISTGLVPMSTLMRAETESLGNVDKKVVTEFTAISSAYRGRPGWSVWMDSSTGRMIANLPLGSKNGYRQMVRFMPNPIWARWSKLPSRCLGSVANRLFVGTDDGRILEVNDSYLNDGGKAIEVDVQLAWSLFGTPMEKQFTMVKPYILTDGTPRPLIDIRTDYDASVPKNQPDISTTVEGAEWDDASWDAADWAGKLVSRNNWQGVAGMGEVGAVRMRASILNCEFRFAGIDVLFQEGTI